MRKLNIRLLATYILIATVLFVGLAVAADDQAILPGDIEITRALQSLTSPTVDLFMILLPLAGNPPQVLILNILWVLILFLCRLRAEALVLVIAIPLTGSVSTWIRCGIDRPRPDPALVRVMDLLKDRGCSFPSGHALNYLIVLGFLLYVGLTRLSPSWHRNLILSIYALFIAVAAISRIYVGDHWPSDVVGGVLLGSIFLILMVLFYEWIVPRLNVRVVRDAVLRLTGPPEVEQ